MSRSVCNYLLLCVSLVFFSGCASTISRDTLNDMALIKHGRYELSLQHQNRVRYFNLVLPAAYTPEKSFPLVVVLHSGGGHAGMIEERTQMTAKAEKENFIVVYPTGSGYTKNRFHTWNSGHCCFYALSKKVDDLGFIRKLVNLLSSKLNVDHSRIYLTGFSNGGMLAYYLAATTPDLFAAVAPVSATIGGYADEYSSRFVIPKPRKPVPLMIFHGTADQQILYYGGSGPKALYHRRDISVADSIKYWMGVNRCRNQVKTSINKSGRIEIRNYACDKQGAPITLVSIKGMGHAWASETRGGWRIEYALLDEPNREISATDMIWDFFRKHRRMPEKRAATR